MPTEQQEWAKLWISGIQALLVLIIAMTSGYWAWYTRAADAEEAVERQANERERVAQQRLTEQRMAQAEAISQMSSQLGLMQAQCNASDRQLRTLGDKETLTLRERQCYEAYIGARSLLFLSSVRIRRDADTSSSEWTAAWEGLTQSLRRAGSVRYSEEDTSENWQAIVGMAARAERREP